MKEYTFDLDQIRPVAARPDFVDDVAPVEEVLGTRIDEAFLGSCNNGRIDDLRVGAAIVKGEEGLGSCAVSGGSGQQAGVSAGIGGRADPDLYGEWGHCHESQLQRVLGKLPGRYRGGGGADQHRHQEF